MSEFSPELRKLDPSVDFRKVLGELSRTRGGHLEVFADFCRLYACELALKTREEEYLSVAGRYSRKELYRFQDAMMNLFVQMDEKPFEDLLGPYYTEINSSASAKARGEYYTPPAIAQLMANLLFSPGDDDGGRISEVEKMIEKGKPITVQEPACGSGGMILSMAELFARKNAVDLLRVTMIDVSPIACDMAYINTTLFGIPAKIMQGSCLTMKFQKSWINFHWGRVGEDQRLALEKMMNLLNTEFTPPKKEALAKPNISFPEPEKRLDDQGQFQLRLDF